MKPQSFTLQGRSSTIHERSSAAPVLVFLHTNALGVRVYLPLCEETVRAGYRLMACSE
ncbi:hypothetical protein [Hymenobacter sp. BT188]|uniref:hypothetical protein n=1 Tax=Hymenobacter sp. BT188 TaxID=2763504 RepID=UPI00165100CF|nr:hypothetical protein [Hymenobacter sp. BT188]